VDMGMEVDRRSEGLYDGHHCRAGSLHPSDDDRSPRLHRAGGGDVQWRWC
jgi:hypothetical protein